MDYESEYRRSLSSPEAFWAEKARELDWFEFPATILSRISETESRWFPGGKLNTCDLAVDRHVRMGRGQSRALIYDSPVTNTRQEYSFSELKAEVARIAGGLQQIGVGVGDRVVIYMPMVPQTVFAMLACARIGAVHSVVFGGFAAPELALRINDATPKVVLSASCGIEGNRIVPYKPLLDEALALARHKPEVCVILQRPECPATRVEPRDVDWHAWTAGAPDADCVSLDATDPLYILYTSGTTGKPKGVVRDNGGHAVALNYSMQAVYGMQPEETFWAASDVGWVVGHSYIVYGPLIRGCASVLFEGKPVGTPDAGVFWRIIQDYAVSGFFTAPTAFRAIRKEDPECEQAKIYDLSSLKHLFVAGERLDPATYHWLSDALGVPVIDHWWQTESGWPICANMAGLGLKPSKAGSPSFPVPGYDLRILDDAGRELGPNEEGNVVLKAPLPPGNLPTVWGDKARFIDAYWAKFPGYFLTGDGGYRDEEGYVYIMGRIDDVINVAGHRLSTGEMEEVVASHPAVAECAVVGIADPEKGQVPLGLVVLKDGVNMSQDVLVELLVALVRQKIGAFANFRRAAIVQRLPKTRSGKILRKVLRQMIDGDPYSVPSTIDDPAILDEIAVSLGLPGD